jgi:hypothetical protein
MKNGVLIASALTMLVAGTSLASARQSHSLGNLAPGQSGHQEWDLNQGKVQPNPAQRGSQNGYYYQRAPSAAPYDEE